MDTKMKRTKEQLAYDAKLIRLQLKSLHDMINDIEYHSVTVSTVTELYDDDNDTFMKVHNQINSAYDTIYSIRNNMRDFSKNHFEAYLEQESQ